MGIECILEYLTYFSQFYLSHGRSRSDTHAEILHYHLPVVELKRYKLVWPWVRTELFRQRVAEFLTEY